MIQHCCGYFRFLLHLRNSPSGIDKHHITLADEKQLSVILRIDGVSWVTCCRPWSQGIVKGVSAHFVTIRTVLHMIT
uniref:Uncharacterized protein n=1 Tax=Timema bartmani TaxID=61472 RepID=A0A7R9I5A7_9NEOP|nr:unnamed protein product [Timema bartmani]